ncbi:MAG: hypothetical protein CSA42_03415 [Gammaproteobacteria bacterium]|nr:MAG: hypothetical protein CSA42_03415 [Gammaproteobacteria bacterium]
MNNLKEKLTSFSNMLSCVWGNLSFFIDTDSTGSLKMDWLQANWELLIESQCGENVFLEVYGDGADCNGSSSRVLYPNKLPTHKIICKSETTNIHDVLNDIYLNDVDEFVFDRFVSIGNDGWYYESPPFDKVLIFQKGVERVIEFNKLEFLVQRIH